MARWERYAPLTGVAAALLWIVGTFLLEKDDRPKARTPPNSSRGSTRTTPRSSGRSFSASVLLFLWMPEASGKLFAAEGGPVGWRRSPSRRRGDGDLDDVHRPPHAQAAFDKDDTSDTSVDALVHMGDAFFGGVEFFGDPAAGGHRPRHDSLRRPPALVRLGQPRTRADPRHPADRVAWSDRRPPPVGAAPNGAPLPAASGGHPRVHAVTLGLGTAGCAERPRRRRSLGDRGRARGSEQPAG